MADTAESIYVCIIYDKESLAPVLSNLGKFMALILNFRAAEAHPFPKNGPCQNARQLVFM